MLAITGLMMAALTSGQIVTCGGDAGGAECNFPFTYLGQTYNACTTTSHHQSWCYTTNPGKWGNCECTENCSVTLYYHHSATGSSKEYTKSIPNLGFWMNDIVSSVKVEGSECEAIIYEHFNYQGWSVRLPTGTYTKAQLEAMNMGFKDNEMSSFKLQKVTPRPTPAPTPEPTAAPTAEPTAAPTAEPTAAPTAEPTAAPTAEPTAAPTAEPTAAPTAELTAAPTAEPTAAPTAEPTAAPTSEPTAAPTRTPTKGDTTEVFTIFARGDTGEEQVKFEVGATITSATLSQEDQEFVFEVPADGKFSVTFLNDNGPRNARLRISIPHDVFHRHFGSWKCGTGSENIRCDMVRDGILAWSGEYRYTIVEPACSVTMYSQDHFWGVSRTHSGEQPTLRPHDYASSVKVNGDGCEATVYEHFNYGGWSVRLTTGSYTLDQLKARGFVENKASSLKVNPINRRRRVPRRAHKKFSSVEEQLREYKRAAKSADL